MHIQASKSSRTAHRGRLFIITLFVSIISTLKVNAHIAPTFLPLLHIKTSSLLMVAENPPDSTWAGFGNMLAKGMQHMRQGTYHLLFLFVLLLPAVLVVSRKKQWSGFGGVGYSLVRIFRITGAFAIGHSVTLLLCAPGLIHFPIRVIEVLMALGILLAALHAYRPIFARKEVYLAACFGLVHGIAFAETLIKLNLDAGHLALGIIAFNLGVELMLGLIIAIVAPWLIILSRINHYNGLRVGGAVLAVIAALAWATEQISNQPNFVASAVTDAAGYGPWLVLLLALCAIFGFFMKVASSTAASSYYK
ncbi:HupE/UreJ family protein [Mucilaginibacter psychrotolerans]|uniref:HupE/UreJ family protein n=1 Tax=Mucilaginibacter psychrotolerans TaxID=1524096 RepID=A0A4Y8SER8_9SPHI|nr:HupE/UreJ family protein [Mucilaginibacter psychrotolerans]TFF37120.1 hypothetical protein E2R66_13640 [Mucilaginibacter psychrotolerans]